MHKSILKYIIASITMESKQLQNQYKGKVLSHVYCMKAQTQTFATLPLG